ncbi:MAG: Trk system potassium transporter TrkA [Chlamydiales bacterium]
MNIIVIGASDIGVHLVTIFSQRNYGIILIDKNPYKLEQLARDLDVAIRLGSGTDWELLEELMELSPDLLVALTNHDETNLAACTIAKNLGYPQTVARVRSNKYFLKSRLSFERLFCVDYLIGPERLTADTISNMILIPDSIHTENFAHGSVQMRTVSVPSRWKRAGVPLANRKELELPERLMVGLICRETSRKARGSEKEHLIFPHGKDALQSDDEVTFVGESEAMKKLHKFFGIPQKIPKSVMIVGGSLIGINLARKLQEHNIRISMLDRDFNKCRYLSEILPNTTVINRDGTDYRFLQSEKVEGVDIFVACTRDDEVNFLAATVAHDLGIQKVIISLTDTSYQPLLDRLGIAHAASPRITASNRILSIARERMVVSVVSKYNNQAEIMEVKVSSASKIAGIPIKHLGPELPQDLLIAMIQSRGRIFIAEGTRVLTPGDTVIVVSRPEYLQEVKKLF